MSQGGPGSSIEGMWGTNTDASGAFLLPSGGKWVERDVLDIAGEIQARWPNLRLASCNCGKCAQEGHYPFVVLHLDKTGAQVPVIGATTLDRRLIEAIAEMHASNVSYRKMKRREEQRKRAITKAREERREEAREIVRSALSSPKERWVGPNGLATDPEHPDVVGGKRKPRPKPKRRRHRQVRR